MTVPKIFADFIETIPWDEEEEQNLQKGYVERRPPTRISLDEDYLMGQYEEIMKDVEEKYGCPERKAEPRSRRETEYFSRWGHYPDEYHAGCRCPSCEKLRDDTMPPAGCGF